MKRVYAAAERYPNEVEHTYSFVQVLTTYTASFAHGANDIGNSVGPRRVIHKAWKTGNSAQANKAPVDVWQLVVLSALPPPSQPSCASLVPRSELDCATARSRPSTSGRVGLLLLSWIMTVPIGGVLMGLFLNAPGF